jgi:quercetin dioxygenase-like cupin family protein
MQLTVSKKWAGCVVGALLLSVSASGQYKQPVPPGFARLDADEINKAGAVYGEASKPGMYVTRARFAPGQGTHPHFHDQDRYITVIKGTWWVSLGPESDVYSPDKMTPLKAGSFIFEPAFGHHYDMAKDEEVLVQIIGPGPVKTTQLESSGAAGGRSAGRGADENAAGRGAPK